jgi:hydrogenase maturation protease
MTASQLTAPTLIFGWGNPSRGDDALGPLFLERLEVLSAEHPEWGEIEYLTDFQLQVEHALDLRGRARVLFVDASVNAPAPFTFSSLQPARDTSFTTHAMTPQAVLQVYQDIEGQPPPCWLLSIRAYQFELGDALSCAAQENLAAQLACAEKSFLTRGATVL